MLFSLLLSSLLFAGCVLASPVNDSGIVARQAGTLAIVGNVPINQIPSTCQAVCVAVGQCGIQERAFDCCSATNSFTAFHCLNCLVFIGSAEAGSSQQSYNTYQAGCAAAKTPVLNAVINGLFANTGLQPSQTAAQAQANTQAQATSAPGVSGPGSGSFEASGGSGNTTTTDAGDAGKEGAGRGLQAGQSLSVGGTALGLWVVLSGWV
ncbi:hypothetical protein MKEN_00207100 [Mycena kentingensis (nom. inval.)]|nr:hypothetical protein MKEN_00207100 [Mycena kentingensis (nom. inval.)]